MWVKTDDVSRFVAARRREAFSPSSSKRMMLERRDRSSVLLRVYGKVSTMTMVLVFVCGFIRLPLGRGAEMQEFNEALGRVAFVNETRDLY